MKSLVSGSLIALALLVFSCKKDVYQSFDPDYVLDTSDYTRVVPEESTTIYKTGVSAYGHYLSGLLVIKAYQKDDYRLVFTTEMGMKLFDFEFSGNDFVVHHCFKKLNKKPVINTLRQDFSLLLARNLVGKKFESVKSNLDQKKALLLKTEDEAQFYYFGKTKGRINKVMTYSFSGKEKVIISFEKGVDVVPSQMILDHKNFDLNIKLDLIKR